MSKLYEDKRITCDDEGITVRQYYFPIGDKRITYEEIRSFDQLRIGDDNRRHRPRARSAPALQLGAECAPERLHGFGHCLRSARCVNQRVVQGCGKSGPGGFGIHVISPCVA